MNTATLSAAIAAGFIVHAAHADIVYTLPPQPITITATVNGGTVFVPIDVDHDGLPEFTIRANLTGSPYIPSGQLWLGLEQPGVLVKIGPGFDGSIMAMNAGTYVTMTDTYSETEAVFLAFFGFGWGGDWIDVLEPAYFGFVFEIDGQPHLGWARASWHHWGLTIYDYAYESVPGAPIMTGAIPAPGAAAVLAVAGGIALRRRRS